MAGATTTWEQATVPATKRTGAWLRGASWDLKWLIGSAIIVPLVLSLVWTGVGGEWIDLVVTLLVGGPHLFSTVLTTYADPGFRRAHWPFLVVVVLAIPSTVTYLAIHDVQLLLSCFIFAASIHVLHQNIYLTDLYRERSGQADSRASRVLDTMVLMLCMYPIAAYKLVSGNFYMGGMQVLIPRMLRVPATFYAVSTVFAVVFVSWIVKTFREHRAGTLNVAKTMLILVTSVVAFSAPAAAERERMEFAFQSINAWHSFQYLAIVWLVLGLRKSRGIKTSKLVEKISGPGRATYGFYGMCFAAAVVLVIAVRTFAVVDPFHLRPAQYFYMVVLSSLLMHYAIDGYMFAVSARPGASVDKLPYAAPLGAD